MNKKRIVISLFIVAVLVAMWVVIALGIANVVISKQQCSTLAVTRYGQLVVTVKGNFPTPICEKLKNKFNERPETFVYTSVLTKNPNLKKYCLRNLPNNRVAIVSSNNETTGVAFCESFMSSDEPTPEQLPSQNVSK